MRVPTSLLQPDFRRYVFGNLFALNGMWAQRAVIAWLAWELSGSASWVGIIAFLNFAPTLFAGPVFGVWADRTDLRRAALIVQCSQAAVSALLLATLLADALTLARLGVIAAAAGLVMSAHHPVRMSIAPRLVGRDALPNAIAVSSINFNVARLLGPAIGGGLIAAFGAAAAAAVTVASFLPIISVLATFPALAPAGAGRARTGLRAALTEGVRIAWDHRLIRVAIAVTGIFALIARGVPEILPVIADGVFARGASGLGQLMAAVGAGALIAALAMSGRGAMDPNRLPRSAVAATFAAFALVALLPFIALWPLALAVAAGIGFCGSYVGVTLQSLVQLNLDDAHRGRVMSLWTMVAIGAAALGALVLGALVDLAGVEAALTAGAAAGVGLTLFALARL